MLRITIVCDEFTLEDVKDLGRYLRGRYQDSPKDIAVLVAADQFPAAEAAAALGAIFGDDPHSLKIYPIGRQVPPKEETERGGNGNK